MKQTKIILILISSIFILSCASIFNGIFLKNQCRKCELIDTYKNEVVLTLEGCGADNTLFKKECKLKAWELSRGKNMCDFTIRCKSWRKNKD